MPSTLIRHFSYDQQRQILRVEFVKGPVYEYSKVPADIYNQMKSAFAKGVYFNQFIRDKFPCQKINTTL